MTIATATDALSADRSASAHRPVYLDDNATTAVDPRVAEEVLAFMAYEFGNAGSRTHSYGQIAKERVSRAREEIASVVAGRPDEVIFTSGATEANNLALLGMAQHGDNSNKRHIVSTQIEHKAVLEPLDVLRERGFEITLVPPTRGGWVEPTAVAEALRPQTLLVSVMAVNNETGVLQPTAEIAEVLAAHDAYFHVDAAQAFGKVIEPLQHARIDLISVSGHKVYGPKGIGSLITRRRRFKRPPLSPLMFGGGQERGLRPGTLPVALIAGFGMSAQLALAEAAERTRICQTTKDKLLAALEPLDIKLNGDPTRTIASTLNFAVPGVDSEAAIVALKDVVAVSNGSACTSQKHEPSHVLTSAELPEGQIAGALRFSWGARTSEIPVDELVARLRALQPRQR